MYIISWFKIHCDCSAINWVDAGDPLDSTAYDVVAFTCWKCKQSFNLDGEEFDEAENNCGDCVNGLKRPE